MKLFYWQQIIIITFFNASYCLKVTMINQFKNSEKEMGISDILKHELKWTTTYVDCIHSRNDKITLE